MSFLRKSSSLQVLFCLWFLLQSSNCQFFNLGNECWNTASCSHWNLKCEHFQCVCWEPLIPSVDRLACAVPNGEDCARLSDVCYDPNAFCQQLDPGAPIWALESCSCKTGFVVDPETNVCKPALGTECAIDGLPCLIGNCIEGKCECDTGLVQSPNGQFCGVPLFGSCGGGQPDCASPNAECDSQSNTCQCKSDHQQTFDSNGVLNCKTSLGGTCTHATECASTHTICEELRHRTACTCQVGYVPAESRTSCLEVTNHWPGTCQENLQCSAMFGRYSVCQSNSCTCVNGYAYLAGDFVCVPEYAVAAVAATT